jgi:hypothetical protein
VQLCSSCTGEKGISAFLTNIIDTEGIEKDTLNYKQWVSTDRCTLEERIETLESFIESLNSKIWELTRHHYVAQAQSSHLRSLKTNLGRSEVIVIGDFAENYSFVVQDAAQGIHWENSQCTVHPFVVYYRDTTNNEL